MEEHPKRSRFLLFHFVFATPTQSTSQYGTLASEDYLRSICSICLWVTRTSKRGRPPLLSEKAELASKKELEGISSFCRLAKDAEPGFQKRIHRRFDREERFEKIREF